MRPTLRTRYHIQAASGRAMPQLDIVVLADLHCNWPFMTVAHVETLVARANAKAPDLILLLGDYAGHVMFSKEVDPGTVATALSGLRARHGVHAVFGNHDWYADPDARKAHTPTKWHTALKDAGIATYSNSATVLQTDPPITLAGLESQRALHNRGDRVIRGLDDWPGLSQTLDPDQFTILMAHEPDIFPDLPDWVDLTISGHTHGGQIAPFGVPLIVPSRYGRRYAYGQFRDGNKQLIVSGGLGCSTLPIRIGRPPEIVLLELE